MNRYIQKLIVEQFNIGNMDLNSKPRHNGNIFNKNMIDADIIILYNKILKNETLT